MKLPQELRDELEARRQAIVRRSSLTNDNSINDVILLDSSAVVDIDNFDGYEPGQVGDWFEFVTKPLGEDEEACVNLVKQNLAI